MKRITKDQVVFEMSKENKAVLSVESGEKVVFETMDCFSGEVCSAEDTVSDIDFSKVNPATGPLFVKGAEVGDVLKVKIEKIILEKQAAVLTAPGLGLLADDIEKEETVITKVNEKGTNYMGFEIPLRKMIGVIGTAPAGEAVNTGTPDDHGGNLDTILVREGSILYLPVNVDGALLSMGDMHSSMGDGEIMGSGSEVAGEIEVKVEVLKDSTLPLPFIETDELYATLASRETMEEASQFALNNMVKFLQSKTDLSYNQAGMFLSLAGDLKVSQAVNPNKT
ncbi:MAG: acetamidase/formamidase family protein, partial [Atopostipes suicloacalis]|nr:acetamidase/formamidase family protein [Atopostipes suicloacalis]MDN6731662.1 acetamidase/formamidase family protein [Atopostipes suicloacalis]